MTLSETHCSVAFSPQSKLLWGLPWWPSVKDSTFPLQGAWVLSSLFRELRSYKPQILWHSPHPSKKKAAMDQVWRLLGLPRWRTGKESACQCRRDWFKPGLGRSLWKRKWQLTPVFLPGKLHGQGSLWTTVHGVSESEWWRLSTRTCARTHTMFMSVYTHIYIWIKTHLS